MPDTLTARELSKRCGESVENLLAWRSLGLIGREGEEAFTPDDAERARLVRLLLRRGVDLAAIARTEKQSGFLAGYMRTAFPEGVGRAYSFGEASQLVGLDVELVRRFSEATGLPEEGRPVGEADVEALKAMKVSLEAGLPEEALLQMARVYVDTLGRVTEAEARLFHFYVHERLRGQGLSDQALLEASGAAAARMAPLTEPMLLYFHRKGFERAMREEAVLQMQERAGLLVEKSQLPGQLRVAIVFVDLSSFTSLAEAMGDDTAAQVLDRFSQTVREAVSRREGRVVKQIGDAFMLVFPEPRSAVTCALEIDRRATAEANFPAVRSGVHWGPVLYREGDYLGANVNLAARLAAEAERHQVLVTAAVRKEVGSLPDAAVAPLGERRLKGLAEELELFAVVPGEEARVRQRLVDPVCGTELDTAEVAARLALAGQERAFCSQECLQRFVATPERYRGGPRRRSGGARRMSAPFLPISAYLEAPTDRQPPLVGEAHADVAIVGGGLTGLSTALALKRAGVDAVVVEREFCGFGASGRNAGHLTPTIGKDLPTLRMLYGEERTAAIVRFADHCVHRTEALIAELRIDCDYTPAGNVMAVVHRNQEKRLRAAAEVAAKVGAKVRFIEPREMRDRGIPPAFLCGALEGAGGTLDPGKLIVGLRHAVLAAGVRIHEGTRVTEVAMTPSPVVRTERGALRAERVVMASNAWTREIGEPGAKIVPLYVTLFETAPLDAAQLSAIGGWRSREGVYTAHEILESYRLTARRTIIGGSKAPRYAWGACPADHGGSDAQSQSIIARAFRDRFPELGGLPIARYWGGWIAMTLNFLPSIGPLGDDRRLWHALGYNGHGVAQATAVGDILADGISGRDNEWARVFPKPAPTLPPEPFLWLTVRGLLAVFGAIDRVRDRQVRAGRR